MMNISFSIVKKRLNSAMLALCTWVSLGGVAFAGELDIQADNVRFVAGESTYIAVGKVEIIRDNNVLLADRVEYEQDSGIIHAFGEVQYRQPDGSVLYAEELHIHDTLNFEHLVDFRAQADKNVRIAASSVRKEGDKSRNFQHFVYTRCERCEENPNEPPIWHIEADEAVHNLEDRDYVMRNAVVRLAGWPVFYTPYFSHPDSTVERRSGLLEPIYGSRRSKGVNEKFIIAPYFWDLGLDKNLLISSAITTEGGKLVDLHYQQALDIGSFKGRVSYGTLKLNGNESASEVAHYDLALALAPQPHVQMGGNLRHTSNPGYLAKNPITTSTFTTLYSSDAYWRQFGLAQPRNRMEASVISFQDTRTTTTTDDAPSFIPEFTGLFFGDNDRFGGRFRHRVKLRHIKQDSFAHTQSLHADSQYQIGMVHPMGIVGNYSLQADISHFRYRSQRANLKSGSKTLFYPRAHGSLRLPFQKAFADSTGVFEPIMTLSLTPSSVNSNTIPNQDAGVLTSNETLFSSSEKYSGITRRDDSTRLSVAAEYSQYWETGTIASLLVGRSFELRTTSITETALNRFEKRDNDYIARARLQHHTGIFIEDRLGIDNENNNQLNSHEVDLSWQNMIWGISPSANYSYHRRDTGNNLKGREDLNLSVSKQLSEFWQLAANANFDLARKNNQFRKGRMRLYYEDDCLKLEFFAEANNATSKFVNKEKKFGATFQLIF